MEKEDDQEIVKLELDVSRSGSGYRSFMYELQRQLAKLTVRTAIEKQPVLPPYKYKPKCLIHVKYKPRSTRATESPRLPSGPICLPYRIQDTSSIVVRIQEQL